LNGALVHSVDIECHGYAGGVRAGGIKIDSFHFSLTSMIEQFESGLPTFLYGNSMGCMVINSFLLKNPDLRFQGIIFSAPFFGFSEVFNLDFFRVLLMKLFSPLLQVSPRDPYRFRKSRLRPPSACRLW
jgi:alpha-beta hydrolase superfamily lysophospholipase